MKELFLLDESVTFLNFGSFGACPKVVFDDYINWQYQLEREPVQFVFTNGKKYIDASRKALADYVNCSYQDLIFVPNPTHAINLVARSIALGRGDEVLSTNLEYGAMDRTWDYYCEKKGARYIQQEITLPIRSKEDFLEEFWKGYSSHTKVIFISQITSSTALILPVKEICEEAKKRGLITIIDGAHVPGHIELDLAELEADVYTGACHKWMMTPKGSSFLYVKPEFQDMLDPLIVSWGYKSDFPSDSKFFDYHQFNGTRDFSAYLAIPAAIAFMEKYNWQNVSELCKKMVLKCAPELFDVLETNALAPLNRTFFGQICSAEIQTDEPEALKCHLYDKYRIEIPVMRHKGKNYIRFSFQAFNTEDEISYLVDSLKKIKKETNLLNYSN